MLSLQKLGAGGLRCSRVQHNAGLRLKLSGTLSRLPGARTQCLIITGSSRQQAPILDITTPQHLADLAAAAEEAAHTGDNSAQAEVDAQQQAAPAAPAAYYQPHDARSIGHVHGVEETGEEGASQAVLAPAVEEVEEEDLVTAEVTEEVEVIDKPVTLQSIVEDTTTWVQTTNPGKAAAVAAAAVLAGTFVVAVTRTVKKWQSAQAARKRQVDRNKLLVEEMSKVIPGNRSKLTPGFVTMLRLRTQFSSVEVFRKYLWFLLRERKFDQGAVDDLVALKAAASLKDSDVAEALKERAQRIYDKYGTLMLNTDGMTAAGMERKASCIALFKKMLYLTEHDPLVAQGSDAAAMVDLRQIFGATEDDVARLRIVSLYDVDLEKAFGLNVTVSVDEEDDQDSITGSTREANRSLSPPPQDPPPQQQQDKPPSQQ